MSTWLLLRLLKFVGLALFAAGTIGAATVPAQRDNSHTSPATYRSGLPGTRRLELVSATPLRSGAVAMHDRHAR